MSTLSDLATYVRKNEYGYPQEPTKSRLPEGVIVGGAALGAAGALGVNNAMQLPKRAKDAVSYHESRYKASKPVAVAASQKAKNASRLNPRKGGFERAAAKANAAAIRDVNNLRANKHVMRNLPKARLRAGMGGGLMLAGGAGLAALGSSMRKKRDESAT